MTKRGKICTPSVSYCSVFELERTIYQMKLELFISFRWTLVDACVIWLLGFCDLFIRHDYWRCWFMDSDLRSIVSHGLDSYMNFLSEKSLVVIHKLNDLFEYECWMPTRRFVRGAVINNNLKYEYIVCLQKTHERLSFPRHACNNDVFNLIIILT